MDDIVNQWRSLSITGGQEELVFVEFSDLVESEGLKCGLLGKILTKRPYIPMKPS